MKTIIYLSNGDTHTLQGHPDEFIEKITSDDHSTIIKDLIMISPNLEDRPIVINARQIVKVELQEVKKLKTVSRKELGI